MISLQIKRVQFQFDPLLSHEGDPRDLRKRFAGAFVQDVPRRTQQETDKHSRLFPIIFSRSSTKEPRGQSQILE